MLISIFNCLYQSLHIDGFNYVKYKHISHNGNILIWIFRYLEFCRYISLSFSDEFQAYAKFQESCVNRIQKREFVWLVTKTC